MMIYKISLASLFIFPHRRMPAGVFVFGAAAILAVVHGVTAQSQRPLTVEDIFKLKEIGSVAVSPDGQWLAYVLKRSRAQAVHYKRDYLNSNSTHHLRLLPPDASVAGWTVHRVPAT